MPFFVALFPQKHGIFMEFLILIFGKGQNMEIVIMESFLFNYIVYQIIFKLTFLTGILYRICSFLCGSNRH